MSRHDADRNLLFGITAFQNDFIARDALINAMAAWAVAKDRSLGEILVEAKALDPADRDALEAMLDRRLAKHNNDPTASIASLSSAGSVAKDLRRSIADPDVLASIDQIPADPYATRTPDPSDPLPTVARYRKVREHAAGNLGVVYVARDEELNRDVALKEIKERNSEHPHHQAKFLLEAEVTGGLEHPGIVPVYGLGHHLDGRPYYAMRFIRGKSLLDAIKKFHADEALRKDSGKRLLELQKLLRRFTDVCNAIAYAHSRGVLHRDLKPDNVMVGKYGETLVVDWGLAKALGQSGGSETLDDPDDPLPEASLNPTSTDYLEATQAGSLVGTPAYMSPEQAAGRLDLLGPASDIYGLGATLYHLIVGRHPVGGATLGEIIANIQSANFARPRTLAPWLDQALEGICLKAMALKPTDRYATPKALAEDLDRWIAGEPVTAYREPLIRRARRWAKKHRTPLSIAATAWIVAALILGGVALEGSIRRQRVDASALAALRKADGLAVEARASGEPVAWERAIAEAVLAEDRAEAGGSPSVRLEVSLRLAALRDEQARLRSALEARANDRRMVEALENARLRVAVGPGPLVLSEKHDAYLAAFRSYGIDVATLPAKEAASRIRASPIADELLSALDDWSLETSTNVPLERLAEIASLAENDPRFLTGRIAFARQDAAELQRICREEFHQNFGPRFRTFFSALMYLDPVGSIPLLEGIRREHPRDFWINEQMGIAAMEARPQRLAEGVVWLAVAATLRPESAMAQFNLGIAQRASGHPEEAIAAFQEATRLDPDNSDAHFELGSLLYSAGNRPGALFELRQSIRADPDKARAQSLLGSILSERGDFDEAVKHMERGQELGSKLPNWPDPAGHWVQDVRRLRDLDARLPAILKGLSSPADAHERIALADVCRRKGLRAAEARFYREAFDQQDSLARDLVQGHRLNAARAASAAGSGPASRDDLVTDEATRSTLREQALGWIRADLADLRELLRNSPPPARKQAAARLLARWTQDPDLAGIRDEASLAKLPEAEREAFRSLWRDVEDLRKRAAGE